MIFAGTGHGFFYSRDDGQTWTQFKDKLPAAPVNWIEVPKNAAEVAVATYGRGLWILRDLWQLEQGDHARPAGGAAALQAAARDVRRAAGGSARRSSSRSTAAPASPITVEVLGADGAVISTSQVQGRAGMNQTSWNLLLSGARSAGAALDSARQPAHLGRGPLAGPRAAGHALGPRRRSAGSRARRPASTPCG